MEGRFWLSMMDGSLMCITPPTARYPAGRTLNLEVQQTGCVIHDSVHPQFSLTHVPMQKACSCTIFTPPKIVHAQAFCIGTCLEGEDIFQLGLLCSNSLIKLMRCAMFLTSCLTLMSLGCVYSLEFILIPTVYLPGLVDH